MGDFAMTTTMLALSALIGAPGLGLSGAGPPLPAQWPLPANVQRACPRPADPDRAACLALVRTDVVGRSRPDNGYTPRDLQDAYALPSATNGSGQTIGIVDAFDDPNAEHDLAFYRRTFGLPPCTSANGCFRKRNQRGEPRRFPLADPSWS